jgi:glycosyltransferase involved in cell wall biosynthesis
MRIGIDAHSAERDGTGNCTYIRGLTSGLAQIDGQNEYFLYVTDPHHPFYERFRNRTNFHITILRPKNPLIRIPLALRRKSLDDDLDVLHVQYIAPPLHKGKLILTIHDLAFLHFPESFDRFERFRLRLLVAPNARRAERILCGSQYSKTDIAERCRVDGAKIEVVPYSASPFFRPAGDDNESRRTVLKKYGIRKKFIFTLGRLNLRKNLKRLISVYAALRNREKIDVQLVIGGKRDFLYEESVQKIQDSGYEEDIILTGFIEEHDLPFLFSAAEVFVYPSLFEGFGLPPLEAMACGCPVVASNVSSIPEIVGDAGVLISPDKGEEIFRAIVGILADADLRESLKKKGLERAGLFSWETTARKTLAVYEAVHHQARRD